MKHQTPVPGSGPDNPRNTDSSEARNQHTEEQVAARRAVVAATVRDLYRPLPSRPSLRHLETPDSYLRRLMTANQLPPASLKYFVAQTHIVTQEPTLPDSIDVVARAKGGLRPAAFDRARAQTPKHPDGTSCPRCVAGIEHRFMCRLCARGETVQQYPHLEINVCPQHLLWIGPGTTPETQIPVGQEALRADRVFRHLHKLDTLDALRYIELRAIFRRWANTAGRHYESPERLDALIYPSTMAVARAVLAPSYLLEILDPRYTFASAYERLRATIAPLIQPNPEIVTDRLWQLLRPAFLAVRDQFGDNNGQTGTDPHGLPVPVFSTEIINQVIRPLEPFGRYLDQLTTCAKDRWTDTTLRLYDWGPFPVAREDIRASSNTRAMYICANGHRHSKAPQHLAFALRHGWTGCPYCSNSCALAGYNSLAETHPALTLEWHPDRNGSTRPSDVVAGGTSKYWWRCPEGHDYEESLNNRSRGRKCPYCSHHRVIPDQTSLEAVAPDLAREWHPTLNGSLTPSMVLSNSGYTVWWLCKRGHAFPAQITARRHGNGCPYCSNKKVLPGVNDLATTHPELASQWHPTLNGTITPRGVVAGAARQIWWQCPLHHIYRSALYNRAGGQGCPFCGHVRVKAGFNDLETKAPKMAAEWDWTRNEGLSPQDVGPGSGRKVWWFCPKGHSYEQVISYRIQGYGCPYCSNRRLLPGDNDFQSRFPALAAEWHPTKNGSLTPSMVFPGNQKRWWLCREGHEKHETVPNRVKCHGCTQCPKGHRVMDQNTEDPIPG